MGVVMRWSNGKMSLRQQKILIINVRHNRNNRWKRKAKKQRQKEANKWCYSEHMRTKGFCFACKLGFVQLICKSSLIFKLNLELALSIISEETIQNMLWWSVDV